MNKAVDVNAPGTIASAVVLGTIGVLSFIVQPGLVQGFVSELGLREAAANDLAFAEMLGVAIAACVAAVISRGMSWRMIVAASLVLAVLGNVGSAAAPDHFLLQVSRVVTGLGEGGVISLSFTVIGLTTKPERNLSVYLVLLLTYGAVGLWAMPAAFDLIGLDGVFVFWAMLTVASLVTVRWLPRTAPGRAERSPTAANVGVPMLVVAMLAVLIYNIAIGVAWANLFLIGMEIEPDEQAIANALLLSQFVAIFGALVPVFMERRLGRWLPLSVGAFGGALCIALLLGEPSYLVFTIAVCGFNFLWNFFMPFLLSSVGDMVVDGEVISVAIALQMIGLGGGPFVAARILDAGGTFQTIEITSIVLLLASFLLLAVAKRARRRALAQSLQGY